MGSVLSNWHYDMNHSISRSIKYRKDCKYWNCIKINVEMGMQFIEYRELKLNSAHLND